MGNWYELYIACPICYNGEEEMKERIGNTN